MNNRTLTQVRPNVWRINHPQTNASLTRHSGFATPQLLKRLFNAVMPKAPVEDIIESSIEFKRGNKSRHWYFSITHTV